MADDRRLDLIEDIIEGLAHGEVADEVPAALSGSTEASRERVNTHD